MNFFQAGAKFADELLFQIDFGVLRKLQSEEHEELQRVFSERILDSKGRANLEDWNQTWATQRQVLNQNNVPGYFKKSRFFRYNHQSWVGPLDWLEKAHHIIIRESLKKFFHSNNAQKLIEIGCGVGQNLRIASQTISDNQVEFYGLDWSPQGIASVDSLGKDMDPRIKGLVFDMKNPKIEQDLFRGSTVLTVHALEQLGSQIDILDWLVEAKVNRVVSVEPLVSNYFHDASAERLLEFHLSRGYLLGYENWLLVKHFLEKSINILSWGHLPIGTYDNESYSIICWEVK